MFKSRNYCQDSREIYVSLRNNRASPFHAKMAGNVSLLREGINANVLVILQDTTVVRINLSSHMNVLYRYETSRFVYRNENIDK